MDLAYITPGLQSLALPLGELHADPANARLHDAQNIAAIRGSLSQFGQRRAAVVQRQGMLVRAGNGMLQAARELGWTHLAAVVVDDDNVSATAFAIADNRAGELADWDKEVLDRLLREIEVADPDVQQMLADLAVETGIVPPDSEEASGDGASELREQWNILVSCRDEAEQVSLLEQLTRDGHRCRALIA